MSFKEWMNERVETVLPSDNALIALFALKTRRRPIPAKLQTELKNMGLIDGTRKITTKGEELLDSPRGKYRIEILSS